MIFAVLAILVGLVLLVISADRFVSAASDVAYSLGISPMVVGLFIMGFGTSAPELLISIISAIQGNPEIALGNVIGSNISNIALILGMSAIAIPITVRSSVLRSELPLLTLITVFFGWCVYDGLVSRMDAIFLLMGFIGFAIWAAREGQQHQDDELGAQAEEALERSKHAFAIEVVELVVSLTIMVISSRLLVWGAVEVAEIFNVDELVIGLTIVALGTSLPELASTVSAARRGYHDMAIGGIIGSNILNTLVVVGTAGLIAPMAVPLEAITRDYPYMAFLTVSLFIIGYGWNRAGRVNRIEGLLLVLSYSAYVIYVVTTSLPTTSI